MRPARHLAALVVALLAAATVSAQTQHEHGGTPSERLGTVHFETTCRPELAPKFDRAVALLHSFWFTAAIDAFTEVLKADPSCSIANWGLALSHWSNPFSGIRPAGALERGSAAVAAAQAMPAKSDRERDYIAAAAELYRDYQRVDQRSRTLAYEQAMAGVARKHPSDTEATIFYALALCQTALTTDKTYANQLKAGAILEPLFARQPDHPGLAHYIIHAYDAPPLAERALDAARRYAKIAPSAPHALHMPSHTFTRLGYWEDSIESNIASAAAARKDHAPAEELHAMDYQTYAYLQLARDADARRMADGVSSIVSRVSLSSPGNAAPPVAGLYAAVAIPARCALERGSWAEAAALAPTTSPFPFAEAISHFARALGAARSGKPDQAARDLARLLELRDALAAAKDPYWTEIVDIQREAATAWVRYAQGHKDEAERQMRSAADREDATDKSAISPGPLAPARELLGEMLLEAGKPAEALVAFEATMKKEPNRFRGLYGAARAAELAGDGTKARTYYSKLLEIAKTADQPGRPELQRARVFVDRS